MSLSNLHKHFKLIPMKKILLLFAVAFPFLNLTAENPPVSDSKNIELEETAPIKGKGPASHPRSTYYLEASYLTLSNKVEIVYDGIGETDIYLVDASGQILYQTNVFSTTMSCVEIPIEVTCGTYSVIIDSDMVYAYGSFTVQ